MKQKVIFRCHSCNYIYPKWQGQCHECGDWNTIHEEKEIVQKNSLKSNSTTFSNSIAIADIQPVASYRYTTGIEELDRVLGGGIVSGSVILLGGEPGIGKSTLLLQLSLTIQSKVLYFSGEESLHQIKLRADRMKLNNASCLLNNEINVESIIAEVKSQLPRLVVIDSIQTLFSNEVDATPGTVTQIRECTFKLQQLAKSLDVPILIIGHINKEGSIAGPKILEHIVDVVLQFEGDDMKSYRILRSIKNRFGSTAEIGIFEMQENGLKELINPSSLFINHSQQELSGSTVTCIMEGVRPFFIETQALVTQAVYGSPQRSANGFDSKRMAMIIAVIEKRLQLHLSAQDVFLNVAGGYKLKDPAGDLAVCAAMLSSFGDLAIPKSYCMMAEIGLSGELRPCTSITKRLQEAARVGYKTAIISKDNLKEMEQFNTPKGIEIMSFESIMEFYDAIF